MLTDGAGIRWGTAAEIAAHLGRGVTAAMVRNWAARDGLRKARMPDSLGRPQVRYPLLEAARIELSKRDAKRGRTRAT
jgi:hypothetical protein